MVAVQQQGCIVAGEMEQASKDKIFKTFTTKCHIRNILVLCEVQCNVNMIVYLNSCLKASIQCSFSA